MHSLEEKNHLSNELERCKKRAEEAATAKASIEDDLTSTKEELHSLKLMIVRSERGDPNPGLISVFLFLSPCRTMPPRSCKRCG